MQPAAVRLTAVLVVTALSVYAQSTTGVVTGYVSDATGSSIPGAKIEIVHQGTNARIETSTTKTGSFSIPSLVPGDYTISVSAAGFKTAKASDVSVKTASVTSQSFVLEIGQVTESVTVTSEAPLINPDSAAVTTTIQNQVLQNLPFTDRSMLAAVMLTPGAQGDPQYSGGVQSELPGIFTQPVSPGASISVGGGRPGGGSILVDGSDVTSAGYSRTVMTFSSDTVQEVSVQAAGIPAQYGRTTSAVINQTTKSGTNEFHGTFNWQHTDPFFQTRALGSAFDPQDRYHAFAGAIGGPVVLPKLYDGRNKTFFYATGEPQRRSLLFGAQPTRLPTRDELQGNFNNSYDLLDVTLRQQNIDAAIASPLRSNQLRYHYNLNAQGFPIGEEIVLADRPVIPNNNLSGLLAKNPIAQRVLSTLYPFTPGVDTEYIRWVRPDGLPDVNGNNAIFARGVSSVDNRWNVKIDHMFSQNDRIYARYSTAPVTGTRFDWGGVDDPAGPLAQDETISKNMAFSHNHIFGATVVNEFRGTYSRGNALRSPNNASLSKDWGSELGLLPAISGAGFPRIAGRGLDTDGRNNGRSIDVNAGFGNDLSWIVGRHSLRMGGEHRRIQLNRLTFGGQTGGVYNFSGQITPNTGSINTLINEIGGLITGSLNSYSYKSVQTNAYYRWRYTALYLQDDFKISQKVTLNLGLRWDVETPRTEKYDRQGSFDPGIAGTVNSLPVTGAFVFAGRNGRQRGLWPTNFTGFQPRLGIAYAPFAWMTWRASYSLLRAPITGVGLDIDPDLNLNANSINSGSRTGGIAPGPINLITNPIGPLATGRELSRDPIFFMNNTNTFDFAYIPQNDNMPSVHKWNLGTQMQIGRDMSLEIGYDGAKGTHLFAPALPFNTPDPSVTARLVAQNVDFSTSTAANNPLQIANADGAPIRTGLFGVLRPYPNFFNRQIATRYDRSGNSIYNALTFGFQKRFAQGLQFQGNYSWSKSIDDGSSSLQTSEINDGFGIVNPQFRDRKLERSLSTFDIPHKFNLAFSYDLPFGPNKWIGSSAGPWMERLIGGFTVSGFFRSWSGTPVTAFNGGSGWFESAGPTGRGAGSGLEAYTLRPDRVLGVDPINPNWRNSPFTEPYLNPAAFAVPGSPGDPRLGNAPRTLPDARSPHVTALDAAIAKNIPFSEDRKVYLQLRADFFNVMNHPVFFVNAGRGNSGAFNWDATARVYRPNTRFSQLDANNTAQYNNYAGRSIRIGARLTF